MESLDTPKTSPSQMPSQMTSQMPSSFLLEEYYDVSPSLYREWTEKPVATRDGYVYDREARSAKFQPLRYFKLCDSDEQRVTKEIKKHFPKLKSFDDRSVSRVVDMYSVEIFKYEVGDHFVWHRDSFSGRNEKGTILFIAPERFSPYTGGELEVEVEDGKICVFTQDPERWRCVILWGSVPHRVKEITSGERYVIKDTLILPEFLHHVLNYDTEIYPLSMGSAESEDGKDHSERRALAMIERELDMLGSRFNELNKELLSYKFPTKKIVDRFDESEYNPYSLDDIVRNVGTIVSRGGRCGVVLKNYYPEPESLLLRGVDWRLYRDIKSLLLERAKFSIIQEHADVLSGYNEEMCEYSYLDYKYEELYPCKYKWGSLPPHTKEEELGTECNDGPMRSCTLRNIYEYQGVTLYTYYTGEPVGDVGFAKYNFYNDSFRTIFKSVKISILLIEHV
jgi:2OG-Fe(II) oxygenase superfamily